MLSRPKLLVHTAQIGACHYRRTRDLPGAVPGLLSRSESQIVPSLAAAEEVCEVERRNRSAAYRPGHHVQVLSALLAESARLAQAKASGTAALRCAM